uniref:Uncharacterized protein n=1 Tax=Avena sativa TaxID=4498 RepID=A0ACD5ZWF5_AVESA
MSASTSGGGGPLSPQAAAELQEGIGLTFGRWTALQMAVENEWGGRDSRAKADQLAASIFSWFANSKGPFYYEDLEDMMFDSISESFHADFEDGSVGEIANEDDNNSSDDDDEPSMGEDEAARSEHMAVDEPNPSRPTPDADGWTTVPPRRGRGRN